MTLDKRYELISQLGESKEGSTTSKELLTLLRGKSRDAEFLSDFPSLQLDELILIFEKLNTLEDQLVIISTICNILLMNDKLRMDEVSDVFKDSVPRLEKLLDFVSEREINTESQYNDFLPIFRLYYLLSYNKSLVPLLRSSILKIGGKLLNFITLSSLDSQSLNKIIIEILKIIYSFVHQGEDSSGLDSVFVLSCNKFNLLYSKQPTTNQDYDEILQHFGNILITISTDISRNYMLNKIKFAENEINYLNKLSFGDEFGLNTPVSNLLTLNVLITIDSDDTELKQLVKDKLNIEHLESLGSRDMNLGAVISDLRRKIDEQNFDFTKVSENSNSVQQETTQESFDNLSVEEKEEELNKIADIFDRIEKNGMLKIQTR